MTAARIALLVALGVLAVSWALTIVFALGAYIAGQ